MKRILKLLSLYFVMSDEIASELFLKSSFLRMYFASMTTLRDSMYQSGFVSEDDHRIKGNSRIRLCPLDFRIPSQIS